MKKITSYIAIFLSCCLFSACSNNSVIEEKKITAAHRAIDSNSIILLDENVPLTGEITNNGLCLVLFNEINEYRESEGVDQLRWSKELADAAQIRAEEATRVWSHTRPNGKPYYTVNSNVVYGENLARGYGTAEETLIAWQESPAHNENLLYPDFKYIALAECDGVISAEFCY